LNTNLSNWSIKPLDIAIAFYSYFPLQNEKPDCAIALMSNSHNRLLCDLVVCELQVGSPTVDRRLTLRERFSALP
jgi:hypothetical protein